MKTVRIRRCDPWIPTSKKNPKYIWNSRKKYLPLQVEKEKDMKRKVVNSVYFDSFWWLNFTYDEYLQMCKDCEREPNPEGSREYWDDIYEETVNDWDCFCDNMEYGPFKDCKCMITGNLGLWNGRPTIIPVLCDNPLEAIKKCINERGIDDWEVKTEDGHIEVLAHHHDGTNCFEIHLLSKKGEREVEREKYLYEDYDIKPWWFKKIYGYLY